MNADAAIADRERESRLWSHRIEEIEVPLEKTCFRQEFLYMFLITSELIVVVLHPSKERRIVRMPHAERRSGIFMQSIVEIIQSLDAREKLRSIFTEHHHELRIPDPDGLIMETFVHITLLNQTRLILDMSFRLFPSHPV